MYTVSSCAKSVFLTLGMTMFALVANADAGHAAVAVSAVLGGSSALLGDYNNTTTYRPGAIPLLLDNQNITISGFRTTTGTPDYVLITQVTLSTGASVPAMVRYTKNGTDQKVIVILRSDSGVGVQYVTNGVKINGFPTLASGSWRVVESGGTTTDQTVINALSALTNVAINTGISDVSADSVKKYSGLTINQTSTVTGQDLAVITLLQLYNTSVSTAQYNFTQAKVNELLVDGAGFNTTDTFLAAFRRENSSGTRITEFLAAVTPDLETVPAFSGTGALLGAVNTTSGAFGYAFITGAASGSSSSTNQFANIRVGKYNGVAPYTGTSLPYNNGQAGYSTANYYGATANGTYTKWTYAKAYTIGTNATVNSIVNVIQNPFGADAVHSVGLTSLTEMSVVRSSFQSFDPIAQGEDVTDGQPIF
ncbi:MAG: hypothetical protein H7145_08640 [Akkermansiaceae bacterium]|nr:hypothetical protein [Armatimonadota bacterium]